MASIPQANYAVALLSYAQKNPDRVAIAGRTARVSYGALARLVLSYVLHLHVRGVTARSIVAIQGKSGVDSFCLALAANALGAPWIHIMHPIPSGQVQPTHQFLIPAYQGETREGFVSVDHSWASAPRGLPQAAAPTLNGFPGPAAPAVIATTSGTTGTPKLVLRSAAQVYQLMRRRPVDEFPGVATTFPMTMLFGFRIAVATLLAGRTLIEPDRFADMRAEGADAVFASPAQIEALLAKSPMPDRRMAVLHVGGAAVTPAQISHWLTYFDSVEIAYGSREAGDSGHMVVNRGEVPTDIRYTLHKDVQVEVVDDAETPVAPGETGHVRLKTPVMALGYYNDAEGSARAFRQGWFYPGDEGFFDPEGRLVIAGRNNDVVNIKGVKINLGFIDGFVRGMPGVAAVAAYFRPGSTGSGKLGVYVVPTDRDSSDAALKVMALRIRDVLERALGASLVPTDIDFVDGLALNDAGKTVRAPDLALKRLGAGRY
jgi:acyl-coenzyme A synthetase/AMP-(fatty) acid ligase